ncbi:MAG: YdbL family protein [Gammaproteobacteria bacterium]|nr:YdbL family protein [Gammaproteobacteria bacterium]MDJ0891481.1 YdbL family protein [Gammaproteobacteria bacterium]
MRYVTCLWGAVPVLLLGACVTINIYFPAAAAEEAADKVIDEVWGKQPEKDDGVPEPSSRNVPISAPVLIALLELTVPVAQAASADINISTPAIKKIEASMRNRHRQLVQHYNSGAVGLTQDGLVAVRDPKAVPLKARGQVNTLIAAENRDRNALYREIAKANGQPQWEADIRATFARRWIERAQGGWWYQAGGGWRQK